MSQKEKTWIMILIGWITIHLLLMMFGGGHYLNRESENFFPIDGGIIYYDYTEVLIYTIPPIVMFLTYWFVLREKK